MPPKKRSVVRPVLLGLLAAAVISCGGFAAWLAAGGALPFRAALDAQAASFQGTPEAQRVRAGRLAFPVGQWDEPAFAPLAYGAANGQSANARDAAGAAVDKALLERRARYGDSSLAPNTGGVYRHADAPVVLPPPPEEEKTDEALERFLSAEVVYTLGETSVSFPAQRLLPYVDTSYGAASDTRYDARSAAEDGVFAAFADELAEAFDGVSRDFIAHDGTAVSVTEKTWRAVLDRAATAEALAALTFDDLAADDAPEGTPVWEKAPLDALQNYVEIDLSNQQLYLYTDGELALETPIVSGDVAQRHTTPGGAFSLAGKSRNVVLRGEDYANFVSYWMPFNNQIGMHDATWRSRFGGTIYKTNGSHGCINLPYDAAATVYATIDKSYAIVCFWR